jgi:hypothetical protein
VNGAVKRFWLSWPQPTEDFRPLTDPPDERVVGWWCSGYDSRDRATLCALVNATNLAEAKAAVRASWPEAPSKRAAWRIEDEHEPAWLPGDRFPLSDWMLQRAEVA